MRGRDQTMRLLATTTRAAKQRDERAALCMTRKEHTER
jgi:hypothetical protein